MIDLSDFSSACGFVKFALGFAAVAHAGQVRKYTGEPYIEHPIAVARTVMTVGHDDGMIAAALLHDVIEDCDVAPRTILDLFGGDVFDLVASLTDVEADGNRAARKAAACRRLAAASSRAQTIKVADLLHNSSSIMAHDPGFAAVYIPEKRAALDVMTHANPWLRANAYQLIEAYRA